MGSRTGTGWAMEFGDDDISIFLNVIMLCLVIYKPQILDKRASTVCYLRPQNFGESGKK